MEYPILKKRNGKIVLYLTNRQGPHLTIFNPLAENQNDVSNIEEYSSNPTTILELVDFTVDGLFINTYEGFTSLGLWNLYKNKEHYTNKRFNKLIERKHRGKYVDLELYNNKYVIQNTYAGIGIFQSTLNRFDTTVRSWKVINFMIFLVIGLR